MGGHRFQPVEPSTLYSYSNQTILAPATGTLSLKTNNGDKVSKDTIVAYVVVPASRAQRTSGTWHPEHAEQEGHIYWDARIMTAVAGGQQVHVTAGEQLGQILGSQRNYQGGR